MFDSLTGRLQDICGREHLFVELQDHGLELQRKTNSSLIDIARHLGAPLLATNDSHYTHRTDAMAHHRLRQDLGAVLRGHGPRGRDIRTARRG